MKKRDRDDRRRTFDRLRATRYRQRKRAIESLPAQVAQLQKAVAALIKEAKGYEPRPMKSVITLGDMQAKGMRMLEVACRRCERHGRLRIDQLIAQYGRDDHSDLCVLIAHDCPRMQNPAISIYEQCGVHFPELPKWFLTRNTAS